MGQYYDVDNGKKVRAALLLQRAIRSRYERKFTYPKMMKKVDTKLLSVIEEREAFEKQLALDHMAAINHYSKSLSTAATLKSPFPSMRNLKSPSSSTRTRNGTSPPFPGDAAAGGTSGSVAGPKTSESRRPYVDIEVGSTAAPKSVRKANVTFPTPVHMVPVAMAAPLSPSPASVRHGRPSSAVSVRSDAFITSSMPWQQKPQLQTSQEHRETDRTDSIELIDRMGAETAITPRSLRRAESAPLLIADDEGGLDYDRYPYEKGLHRRGVADRDYGTPGLDSPEAKSQSSAHSRVDNDSHHNDLLYNDNIYSDFPHVAPTPTSDARPATSGGYRTQSQLDKRMEKGRITAARDPRLMGLPGDVLTDTVKSVSLNRGMKFLRLAASNPDLFRDVVVTRRSTAERRASPSRWK